MNSHQPELRPHNNKLVIVSWILLAIILVGVLISACVVKMNDLVIGSPEVTIINANLTRFELTSTGTIPCLSYNLTITMSIRNSVWYHTADYHDLEVGFYYNMEQFNSVKLEEFSIKPGGTLPFNISRSGNSTISINLSDTGGMDDPFRRSNETRFFEMKIWLKGLIQSVCYLSYQCKLNLQLITSQNSSTQGSFKPVLCY
ncbi:hypothetical protein FCM35_KLT00482 [Carex littledalei]|uniref:Late embryogenesis abundant protein LEA-2 subgroup domain-containing protein n=1 Tax=Carex littledalei TaxID=544730 RepID=A0A833RIJ3_9POAL|nr:hypothetical protein FCM35_KLT00482 [Carex littledalei]